MSHILRFNISGIIHVCARVAPTLPDPEVAQPDPDGTRKISSPWPKGRSMTFGNAN